MAKRKKTVKKGFSKKLLYGVVLASATLLAVLVGYYLFFLPYTGNWTASIIDQLTIDPNLINPTFNASCISMLNSLGFDVKYYPSKDITVNFCRDLPSKGGKILVVRAHSAVRDDSEWVDLFTSEIFREGLYIDLARKGQISKAQMYSRGDTWYFAIGPTFVESSTRGRFDDDCVIILMGCNSLNKTTMAEALVGRGAKVVIGWTNWVEADYTDSFTMQLLQHLLTKNYTIKGAVDNLNSQISQNYSNPYNTTLAYYPISDETSNYFIPIRDSGALDVTQRLFQILLSTTSAKRKLRISVYGSCN